MFVVWVGLVFSGCGPRLSFPAVWWGGVGVGLFFENCTVDASIFLSLLVFKFFEGTRWMPWHQEPMKDVEACDMPRGVGNQTLIRGCPNGETWHSLWGVAAV